MLRYASAPKVGHARENLAGLGLGYSRTSDQITPET
jgi:hypothetical protein